MSSVRSNSLNFEIWSFTSQGFKGIGIRTFHFLTNVQISIYFSSIFTVSQSSILYQILITQYQYQELFCYAIRDW